VSAPTPITSAPPQGAGAARHHVSPEAGLNHPPAEPPKARSDPGRCATIHQLRAHQRAALSAAARSHSQPDLATRRALAAYRAGSSPVLAPGPWPAEQARTDALRRRQRAKARLRAAAPAIIIMAAAIAGSVAVLLKVFP